VYSSSNTVRMREKCVLATKIYIQHTGRKISQGKAPRRRWEDNITLHLTDTLREGAEWTQLIGCYTGLSQDRVKWWLYWAD
jgi:hypothetical protein